MSLWRWTRIIKSSVSRGFHSYCIAHLSKPSSRREFCEALRAIPAKFQRLRWFLSTLFQTFLQLVCLGISDCGHWVNESAVNICILIVSSRLVNTFDILLFLSPCTFTQFTNFFWWLTVPGSISKKPRSRNIFSSFFCCFGAQSTAAGSPCTTVSHSNHNHNHNDNSITEDKTDSKVGISVRRGYLPGV